MEIITSLKLAGPNKQNQTGSIQLFSTQFVLICIIIKNCVLRAVLKKKKKKNMSLLA